MQLRVAAVDDLPQDVRQLHADLTTLAKGRFQLDFHGFSSGGALLEGFVPGRFDLIFMDICMEGISGIDAAREVRRLDPHCLLVFLTTSPDFTWQSFSLHPFDYLLKPCQLQRLEGVINEALRALDTAEPEIELRLAHHTMRLPLRSIYYAVAQNHSVAVMTPGGVVRSISIFRDLQARLLQDDRFLLCNRGLIVNMEAVLQFDVGCIRMLDGTQFAVRQKSKNQLFNTFTQYQFSHMKKE